MENIAKGWFLTSIGVIGFIATILHATGFYVFPNPDFLSTKTEIAVSLIVNLTFIVFPKTKIEGYIEELLKQLFALVKKKD